MSLEPAVLAHTTPASTPPIVPHRRWLVLGRVLWVFLALLCTGLFIAGVPIRFGHLRAVCPQASCTDGRMTTAQAQYLLAHGISTRLYATVSVGWLVVAAVVWSTVSLLIFLRTSHTWMTWFVSLFLVTSGVTFSPVVVDALAMRDPTLAFLVQLVKNIALVCLFLFFCLFPDGHFAPRWTRWIVLVYPLLVIASEMSPGSPIDIATWSPLLNWLVLAPNFGVIMFAQVYRYRYTSNRQQRQQTKWVIYGASVALLGLISLVLLSEVLNPSLNQLGSLSQFAITGTFTLLMLLIPLTIGVAILRYRLYDIDLIIHRTLVYGTLTVCVAGVYVLVVGYLGALFQAEGNFAISLVTTGIVAVLFQPMRARLQRGITHLLYGERDEPYTVIARLGQRLEATLAPDAVLPTIVETVAHALKVPYVAIVLSYAERDRIAAEAGAPQPVYVRLPLMYQGETVGYLLLAARAPGEPFTSADQTLLDVLADQAGVAVHAVRLTHELQQLTVALQQSRERLITTREEERRRLRRDLHDGIGPTLASLAQRLDVAQNLVEREPSAATALLSELKGQVKHTIADIRRLVYALRPPVLDEFGLISAIREHIMQMTQSGNLHIMFDAPDDLPPLPAAVEVAAYRICLEAVTNVMRHAQARNCRVALLLVENTGRRTLSVEIVDDGIGVGRDQRAGVGLTSMRERATELGGTCSITHASPAGTRVLATLPLSFE